MKLMWIEYFSISPPGHIGKNAKGEMVCKIYESYGKWILDAPERKGEVFFTLEQAQERAEYLFGEKPLLAWNRFGGYFNSCQFFYINYYNIGYEKHRLFSMLPGTGSELNNYRGEYIKTFKTVDAAKLYAEEAFRDWLAKTKLRPEE